MSEKKPVMSPREAAAKAVRDREAANGSPAAAKKPAPAKVYERSRTYPLVCSVIMWVGFFVGLLGFIPNLSIAGVNLAFLGIPGGILCLVGVFMLMGSVKCPACGSKHLGRAFGGVRVPRSCECPECHAKVNLK